MDLMNCKGLLKEVNADIEFLEYRTKEAEHKREVFRRALQMHMDAIEVLRDRIGKKTDALKVLEEYADTLDPAHGQIVKLRLLDGLEWSEVAEATGFSLKHVQRIYKEELQRFPPEVWERFCRKWEQESGSSDSGRTEESL